jgi:DNA polymerase-3 subunit gamma/tau
VPPHPAPRTASAQPKAKVAAAKPADEPAASGAAPRLAPSVAPTGAPQMAPGLDWRRLIDDMRLNGMVRELAQHCELARADEGALQLRLTSTHRHLFNPVLKDKLQSELQGHFGRPVRVNVEIGDVAGATPAQESRAEQAVRHEQAVAALEQDGFVQNVIDMFDATLNESSIKPL